MPDKPKLQPDFIPVWKVEFNDLRTMPQRAFLLQLIYRAYRDPQTSICSLSDYEIQRITAWERTTIKAARRFLLKNNHIKPAGYHTYILNDFKRFKLSTCSRETPLPQEESSRETPLPIAGKPPYSSRETLPEKHGNPTSTLYKSREELLESNNNPLPSILKDDLKLLFTAQGQQGDPLLVFFYTVAQERLNKGYKPGILRVAIKRAISANSKANIQDILSFEALAAIKADQGRQAKQAAEDIKLKEWQNGQRFEGSKKEVKA
ncbi:MAG: hypothetical protein KKH77_07015 [Candidatus Omnitrophica bacterium]|nr:hypothetical protein [Candidatus Omnitrophota bacterium]MBU1808129.1 hypothetical protein [Candidatus Omnitrophota bacterium]